MWFLRGCNPAKKGTRMIIKQRLRLWWTFRKMKRRARQVRKAYPAGKPIPMASRIGVPSREKLPEGAVMRLG